MSIPIAMCFSGGKDSALALRDIQQQGKYAVVELLTTVTEDYDRVSMHGVRRTLLRQQADAIGIRLREVAVPPHSSNAIYEREMGQMFRDLWSNGIRHVAFGDIFLEDLRTYRERQLAEWNLECLFPIWKRDTTRLAQTFISDGFEAIAVCVNPDALDASFAGRRFDRRFLVDLPPEVDPCGENGEFQFVFNAPYFRRSIPVDTGRIVERSGFVFCDVLPRHSPAASATDHPEEE